MTTDEKGKFYIRVWLTAWMLAVAWFLIGIWSRDERWSWTGLVFICAGLVPFCIGIALAMQATRDENKKGHG